MFFKVGKIGHRDRKTVPDSRSLVKNCEFLDVRATGIHSMITGCSCVISMDLTVCHKQIEEEWRLQIIVLAKHKFSSIERIDLENI